MKRRSFVESLMGISLFPTIIKDSESKDESKPLYYEVDRPVFDIQIKGLDFKQSQYCYIWTTIYKHSFKRYVEEHSKLHHVVVYKWGIEGGITANGTYDGYVVIQSVLLPKNQPYEYVFDSPIFKPVYTFTK